MNEKLIWKSNLHEKNKITRGQNCAVGRLGQYIVGDPEAKVRLDDKMKAVTSRQTPSGALKSHSMGFDMTASRFGRNSYSN